MLMMSLFFFICQAICILNAAKKYNLEKVNFISKIICYTTFPQKVLTDNAPWLRPSCELQPSCVTEFDSPVVSCPIKKNKNINIMVAFQHFFYSGTQRNTIQELLKCRFFENVTTDKTLVIITCRQNPTTKDLNHRLKSSQAEILCIKYSI